MVEERAIVENAPGETAQLASISAIAPDEPLVVDEFSSWSGENDLSEYSSAGVLENGDGSGELVDGALRLEFDGAGWFLSNVREDVSDYTHLELDVRGEGVDEDGVQLEVGDVEAMVSELTDDSIGTEFSTVSVDLVAAGVDRSSVDDVWLTFWRAGSGAIELDSIRFVAATDGDGPPAIGDSQPADTTGDGLYNDITGSGSTTTTDVTVFFENIENPAVTEYPQYYDFDGSGSVSISDVIELFESL